MNTDALTVSGRRLEIREFAATAPGRPACVLLHEGIGSVSMWRDFPATLAARTGARVVAYSRAGYGRSAPRTAPFEPDYMHREALEVLPALLAELHVESPILIGHSDGASIALIFAGAHPESPRGVVVMAPHVFVEDLSIAGVQAALNAWRTTDLRERLARHHGDPEHAFFGWNDAWLDPRFRAWNIERSLASIRVPVLAIQGEDDNYGTMAQLDAICAQVSGPCEQLRLAGCGHSPHRDQPERTLAAVAGFVARVGT